MGAQLRSGGGRVVASLALACALCAGAAGARAEAPARSAPYAQRAIHVAARLGVPGYAAAHGWALQPEAPTLVHVGRDVYGRPLQLAPRAATAMRAMVAAAARDGVVLQVISGFRSFEHQRRLVRRKLDRGQPLASVLQVNALPGYSEHHSGRALDLTTPGVPAADAAFAGTPAYDWLVRHAGDYGFALSYPAGNVQGIAFEPWHWRYAPPAATTVRRLAQASSAPQEAGNAMARLTPERAFDATLARASSRNHPIVQAYP
ncbi:M15 family metallopeptidase [Frateuria sp. MAH-13]|uniref:M15 family metallopeptidase n=1 Tax=Frateuria flava TaxID=2821489 RepID=A0ABS4DHZ5_9GAMM|nr:M15 family metallopeptidase [Frateuria flava]MBP1472669.1 M15 family metallopeptidase [Frateuria flava]